MESLQWRRHPEIADFCPLSWSSLSWPTEGGFGDNLSAALGGFGGSSLFRRTWETEIYKPFSAGRCCPFLREAKPGGVSHFFFLGERSRLCRGPFRDCSSSVLLIGQERGKGLIGKIPGPSPSKSWKSQKNRDSPKKGQKKEGQVQIGKPLRLKHPRFAALERWAKSPIANRSANAVNSLASHSAIPRGTTVAGMNANRTIRIAAQGVLQGVAFTGVLKILREKRLVSLHDNSVRGTAKNHDCAPPPPLCRPLKHSTSSTTNTGSVRTNFCVSGEIWPATNASDSNHTARTLASDSAITIVLGVSRWSPFW